MRQLALGVKRNLSNYISAQNRHIAVMLFRILDAGYSGASTELVLPRFPSRGAAHFADTFGSYQLDLDLIPIQTALV